MRREKPLNRDLLAELDVYTLLTKLNIADERIRQLLELLREKEGTK